MKKFMILGITLCGCVAHGQSSLDQDPKEAALSAALFAHTPASLVGTPTPTPSATPKPTPAQPHGLPWEVYRMSGTVFQKIGEHEYLVRCDDEHGLVLLRGEPTNRYGDHVEAWVKGDGPTSYETITGRRQYVFACHPTAAPTPTPTKMQQTFGPNSKMKGSALGQ